VQVYVPVSADVPAGFLESDVSGAYSLLLDSIDVKEAGNSSATFDKLLGCLRDCGTNGYCWGICRTLPGMDGGTKLKVLCCGVACDVVEYADELSRLVVAIDP